MCNEIYEIRGGTSLSPQGGSVHRGGSHTQDVEQKQKTGGVSDLPMSGDCQRMEATKCL